MSGLTMQFFASRHAVLRRLALSAVNQFVVLFPRALFVNMDTYVQGLFSLANDSAAEVRKLVCAGLVQLLEVQPSYLQVCSLPKFCTDRDCDLDVHYKIDILFQYKICLMIMLICILMSRHLI
jgi:hypothetical protein